MFICPIYNSLHLLIPHSQSFPPPPPPPWQPQVWSLCLSLFLTLTWILNLNLVCPDIGKGCVLVNRLEHSSYKTEELCPPWEKGILASWFITSSLWAWLVGVYPEWLVNQLLSLTKDKTQKWCGEAGDLSGQSWSAGLSLAISILGRERDMLDRACTWNRVGP